MKKIPFFKMNGSGNDFIIINNRDKIVESLVDIPLEEFVQKVCKRGLSVGADGLILIEKDDVYDFRWRFFNSDGSEVEMCGNGSRCAARFAYLNSIAPLNMKFSTLAGVIEAQITGLNTVRVQLTNPKDYKAEIELEGIGMPASFINTGVPHVVYFVDNVDVIDVKEIGAKTRYHDYFKPEGTNVNFAEIIDENTIKLRTYERGVEDETLACGTGATAAAVISVLQGKCESPVDVLTKGGKTLKIYVYVDDSGIKKVYLEGEALLTYIGTMIEEAWNY
ncbi:diaminopimelate epimerase [Hippea alviniae]|uniref:diaminopimelate epimerase n=1 Tax=Hippea alviniae TaxID=1279027 RepID=UPI0003B61846|nr:diaminopimelate epimerase [Hippea alviniae]